MALKRDYDYLFKLVLIGDQGIGKSCCLLRFADDAFTASYIQTIGVDFRFRTNIVADKTCKLQIWDTAGAERFRTITSAYYRGAHGIVLMYDITNRQSFDNLDRWIDEVRRHSTDNVVIMVAGLKSDLTDDRQVTESEGQKWAESKHCSFLEISSKNDVNVNELFQEVVQDLLEVVGDSGQVVGFKRHNDNCAYFTTKRIKELCDMDNDQSNGTKKKKKPLTDRTKQLIVTKGVSLTVDGGEHGNVFDDEKKEYPEIIGTIFDNIIEWVVVNYAKKALFEKMINSVDKLKKCNIKAPTNEQLENETLLNLRDNRLYAVGIGKVKEFECVIDNVLLDEMIHNSYPYKLWNKFSAKLINNENLEILKLNITNEAMNDPLKVKKLADIFKCIEKSKMKLRDMTLSFSGDIAMNYTSHNDGVLRNVLYSSIIKSIKSKSKCIEQLEIKFENDTTTFHLFDAKFVSQLMDISYSNLTKLEINLPKSRLNHNVLSSMYTLFPQCQSETNIGILGDINIEKFDQKRDQKIAKSLTLESIAPESEIAIGFLTGKSAEYCKYSLSKLIQDTISFGSILRLFFDETNTDIIDLYPFLDTWLNKVFELYTYYKEIKDYIMNENNLTILNEKVGSETIKQIIYDYIQCNSVNLELVVVDPAKMSDGVEFDEDNMERMLADLAVYMYQNIREFINENDIRSVLTEVDIDEDVPEYKVTLKLFSSMIEIFSPIDELTVRLNDEELFWVDMDDFEKFKQVHEMNKDHSLLICGFIRAFMNNVKDIYIPYSLWRLIFQFYPKYDVYAIELDEDDSGLPIVKTEKALVTCYCDNPKFIHLSNQIYWKSLNNDWFNVKWIEECEPLFGDLKIKDITTNKPFMQYLSDQDIHINNETKVNFLSQNWQTSNYMACVNNGDIIEIVKEKLENYEGQCTAFNANTFMISDDNDYMLDIASMDSDHVLFLTAKGRCFSLGSNEYGQCGRGRSGEEEDNKESDYKVPFFLKKLSKHIITNIYVGDEFSLCIDKNKNVHCWGRNEDNVMGLDMEKYRKSKKFNQRSYAAVDGDAYLGASRHDDDDEDEDIIWEPIIHDLFNNGKEGKIIQNINCGETFICYIDNEYQCYWSPPTDNEEINIVHLQSINNGMYQHLKIKMSAFSANVGADMPQLALFDVDNRGVCYDGSEDEGQRLIVLDIHVIQPGDFIAGCAWQHKEDSAIIFVKRRMS